MCAPRIDVVARAVVRPVPEGHEFGAWRRIEHKIRDCAWGYATVNSELYYTVHVLVSQEFVQAWTWDTRRTVDEGPVTGAGRGAGAARSRGHDAHGDQPTGLEVGDRVVGHRAGHLCRDWSPACMSVE